MGSYFGSSLCAVDLNSDGLSDLLVGAPMFSEIRDEGQVTVYINRGNVSISRRWLGKEWGCGSGQGNADVPSSVAWWNLMSQTVGPWMSPTEHAVTKNSSGIMVSQTPTHIHHRAVNLSRRSGKVSGFILKLRVICGFTCQNQVKVSSFDWVFLLCFGWSLGPTNQNKNV